MFQGGGQGGATKNIAFHPNAHGDEIQKFLQDGIIDMYCFIRGLVFLKNIVLADV